MVLLNSNLFRRLFLWSLNFCENSVEKNATPDFFAWNLVFFFQFFLEFLNFDTTEKSQVVFQIMTSGASQSLELCHHSHRGQGKSLLQPKTSPVKGVFVNAEKIPCQRHGGFFFCEWSGWFSGTTCYASVFFSKIRPSRTASQRWGWFDHCANVECTCKGVVFSCRKKCDSQLQRLQYSRNLATCFTLYTTRNPATNNNA